MENKKDKTCVLIDVAIPEGRSVMQNGAKNKEIQEFMCRDTTNVEHEMYDHTNSN